LPYFILEARYNTQLNVLSKDNLVTGFIHGPQLNLQMDGLFDVFNPRIVKGGIQSITTMTSTPTLNGYHYVTYGSGTIQGYAKVVTPFIAITPIYTFAPHYNHKPSTNMFGLGANGRISILSADINFKSGNMGFGTKAPVVNGKPSEYKTKFWDPAIDNLSGTQNVTITEYRVGIELVSLVFAALYPNAYGTKKILYNPRYFRFYIGWGGGCRLPLFSGHSKLEILGHFSNFSYSIGVK
jgi:hypothetical protein